MSECDQPPDHGKGQPGKEEAERKGNQRPTPLGIDQGGEDVLQEAQSAAVQLGLHNIAVAILEDRPLPEPFRGARSQVAASWGEIIDYRLVTIG